VQDLKSDNLSFHQSFHEFRKPDGQEGVFEKNLIKGGISPRRMEKIYEKRENFQAILSLKIS
jgi:hypothetical protein